MCSSDLLFATLQRVEVRMTGTKTLLRLGSLYVLGVVRMVLRLAYLLRHSVFPFLETHTRLFDISMYTSGERFYAEERQRR